MAGLTVGYARVSTDTQDLTAQRDALAKLGVPADRVYAEWFPVGIRGPLEVTGYDAAGRVIGHIPLYLEPAD